jgi:putative heme-binding domain-containing protein
VVRQAAWAILAERPAWAKAMIGPIRRRLALEEPGKGRSEELVNQLLALARDPEIQDLVARTLRREQTPLATRLLLLEVISRAPLDHLPATWIAELRWALEHPDGRVVGQAVAGLRGAGIADFDAALRRIARDQARSEELRLQALAAVGPRLSPPEPAEFTFLLSCLDAEKSPLLRLTAAGALGQARLTNEQLDTLAPAVARAGALELSRLLGAYEHRGNAGVGKQLLAALARCPSLPSLTPDLLRRTLKPYPPSIQQEAEPLLQRLEADSQKQAARLAELEAHLAPGDALRGQQVFESSKAACTACHAVHGQGAHIGPDLGKIGAIRARRDLLESIVFPSASIVRGYEPYVVTTHDGRFYTGIIGRETTDALVLITADRAEIRLPRAAIDTIEPGRVSIMPQGLDTQLTRQELADVLAFLQALR